MITHPGPERVFIAGGGEGATLREVLYHKSVKQAVMVDIDRDVIEASRRYLPAWHEGAFDDPRTTLFHQDAKEYLENTDATFDVIFIDLSDPVEGNPSALLFTEHFYKVVRDRLAPGGIMAIQAETVDFLRSAAFTAICHTLSEVFDKVVPYHAVVPSFSGDWGFATASSDPGPLNPLSSRTWTLLLPPGSPNPAAPTMASRTRASSSSPASSAKNSPPRLTSSPKTTYWSSPSPLSPRPIPCHSEAPRGI